MSAPQPEAPALNRKQRRAMARAQAKLVGQLKTALHARRARDARETAAIGRRVARMSEARALELLRRAEAQLRGAEVDVAIVDDLDDLDDPALD